MKKILLIWSLLIGFGTPVTFAQDKTGELLTLYYNLEDALVAGNTTQAAQQATALAAAAGPLKEDGAGIARDAQQIAAAKNIEKQRGYFASLSTGMIHLLKAGNTGGAKAYELYCPMKKASWISKDRTVRNPYFGNSMLNCGSVKDSL